MIAVVVSIPTRAALILAAILNINFLTSFSPLSVDAIIYSHYIVLELVPCLAILYAITQVDPRKSTVSMQLRTLLPKELGRGPSQSQSSQQSLAATPESL
jgi:hypothetical protein